MDLSHEMNVSWSMNPEVSHGQANSGLYDGGSHEFWKNPDCQRLPRALWTPSAGQCVDQTTIGQPRRNFITQSSSRHELILDNLDEVPARVTVMAFYLSLQMKRTPRGVVGISVHWVAFPFLNQNHSFTTLQTISNFCSFVSENRI